MTIYLLIAASYLLGSIPFGVLLTRAFGAGDLRQVGSGNIGATNVLRTGRKGLAAARSEEHTSELQSLMRISYAIFGLKKKKIEITNKRGGAIPPSSKNIINCKPENKQ